MKNYSTRLLLNKLNTIRKGDQKMNMIKNSLEKDTSIIEKASKQKYFNFELVFTNKTEKAGIWAIDLEEAKDKIYFKYLLENESILQVII